MSDERQTTPLDYLKDRVSSVARGVPVRDLDEALEAVRAENKRLRRFVQWVADCSNDPAVVDEAYRLGAKS